MVFLILISGEQFKQSTASIEGSDTFRRSNVSSTSAADVAAAVKSSRRSAQLQRNNQLGLAWLAVFMLLQLLFVALVRRRKQAQRSHITAGPVVRWDDSGAQMERVLAMA